MQKNTEFSYSEPDAHTASFVKVNSNFPVYITNYNMRRLHRAANVNFAINDYDDIYTSDLSFIFDKRTLHALAVWKIIYEDLDIIVDDLKKLDEKDSIVGKLLLSGNSGGAFHYDHECESLKSDYFNINLDESLICDQTLVKNIQDFVQKHHTQLIENPSQLLETIKAKFNLYCGIKLVHAPNSGRTNFANYDLETLKIEIDKLIEEAHNFMYSDIAITRLISKLGYGSWNRLTRSRDKNNTLYFWFNQYKQPLLAKLHTYLRISLNPDLSFKGSLLTQLGFRQCKRCSR
jgi:hypothetical protein